jgi:hypothetical protein
MAHYVSVRLMIVGLNKYSFHDADLTYLSENKWTYVQKVSGADQGKMSANSSTIICSIILVNILGFYYSGIKPLRRRFPPLLVPPSSLDFLSSLSQPATIHRGFDVTPAIWMTHYIERNESRSLSASSSKMVALSPTTISRRSRLSVSSSVSVEVCRPS